MTSKDTTGAEEALAAAFREHRAEINGFLRAVTRNAATAEDLVQEVFRVALRREVRTGPGLRRWLKTVARNLAMNELRKHRPAPVDPADLCRIADSTAVPVDFADEEDLGPKLGALRRCLRELPERDRKVLAARYEREEPLESIARQEKQTMGYIKQRLFRLRRRLARCVRSRLQE